MASTSHLDGLSPGWRGKGRWRSPLTGSTISVTCQIEHPTETENAHGSVYRLGRPRVKLHGGSDRPERAQAAVTGLGNQRQGFDQLPRDDSQGPSPVPGGRHPRELAVRGPEGSRRGDRGGGRAAESRSEERQAGCLQAGGRVACRVDREAGVQGIGGLRGAPGLEPGLHDLGDRLGADPESDQGPVPVARDRDQRTEGVPTGESAGVLGEASWVASPAGQHAVPGARCGERSEEASREVAAGRGQETQALRDLEDMPGLGADSHCAAFVDRCDPLPLRQQAVLLGVLRSGCRHADVVGLGAHSGWQVGVGSAAADAGSESRSPDLPPARNVRFRCWAEGEPPRKRVWAEALGRPCLSGVADGWRSAS